MNRRDFLLGSAAAAGLPPAGAAEKFDGAFGSARDAAAAIKAKKISSVELTTEAWRRIDRYNPKINAIIWPLHESSMAEAKAADLAIARKQALGPMHGVPVTIKESFHIEGTPTTWGIAAAKDFRPKMTALVVERLRKSGAVVLGKTNVPLMLLDQQSYNEIYGTTNNPYDLKRTPGGSTGGGAAALAAGMGFATIGSDIGGSIRVPAHFSGVYGLKPTLGLVPELGQTPPGVEVKFEAFQDLAVTGPLARTAVDLHEMMSVVAGPAGWDAKGYRWTPAPPRHRRLGEFRVGYVLDDPLCTVSSELPPVYERTLRAVEKSGAKLVRGWPEGVDAAKQYETYLFLLAAAVGSNLPPPTREAMKMVQKGDPAYGFALGVLGTHGDWIDRTRQRLAARAAWESYFGNVDVFLSPVSFTPAYPHDHSQPQEARVIAMPNGKHPFLDSMFWIHTATLTGMPAVSAPVGFTAGGLPVGLQIMGPYMEDGTAIEFAAALAGVTGGFKAPKGFS